MGAAADLAAQPAGAADPPAALDQLRRHRQGDGDRGSDLVEGVGCGRQQPLGIGERVGRPQADDHGGQAEPVVERGEDPLDGDRTTDADPRRRVGQRHLGQREHDVATGLPVEHDAEHDPDRDDDQPGDQVGGEAAGPRGVAASGRHDQGDHGDEQAEHQRVGGAAGGGGQAERPDPPRPGVQVTGRPVPPGASRWCGSGPLVTDPLGREPPGRPGCPGRGHRIGGRPGGGSDGGGHDGGAGAAGVRWRRTT